MNYLYLFLLFILSASATEVGETCPTNVGPIEFAPDNDLWWMANTELVLVVGPAEVDSLESVMYIGPMGAPYEIERQPRVVTESLLGNVASGKIEVWNAANHLINVPTSGIIFVNRWALAHVNGGLGTLAPLYDVYASDVVGVTSGRRQLRFVENEVFADSNQKVCVGTTSLLRSCDENEIASTPEEVISHLRQQLSPLPGYSIEGSSL